MRIYFSFAFLLVGFVSFAQFLVSGTVKDNEDNPLAGAQISLSGQQTISDSNGHFSVSGLPHLQQILYVSYLGFQTYERVIELHSNQTLSIILQKDEKIIEQVSISGTVKIIENKERISGDFIHQNFSGSFAQSLENVAGVNVINIGSGAGKPIIRGLGFSRVAVSLNGNKHEGQQWGADHGLEVDVFSLENVELIKGVASIEYGSDAIAGVLNINNNLIPDKNHFEGKAALLGRSVNNTIGTAFEIKQRKDKFFYKLKTSYLDYGDFRTPTDTIIYLTRKIPIHNRKLKNTAGQEWNIFGQIGYVEDNYHSILTISNNQTKAGFFPGSHGIPDLNRLQDDRDSRNIEYPYQRANHFMVQNEHKWSFYDSELLVNLVFQNNHRQEKSEFHTHYSNQLPPEKDSDLELDFSLNTFSGNTKYTHFFSEKHKTDFGIQIQVQDNNIKGFNFLLPEYYKNNYGIFALHNLRFSDKFRFDFGLRYDFSNIKIREFYDEILYNYLIGRNYSENLANEYALRSPHLSRNFSNFNLKTGALYSLNDKIDFTLNLGSSFRNPTAIELGANGIHHGSFRHERGDENLNSEKGYIIDFQSAYIIKNFSLNFNPYLYYFTNYIYLRPTGEFSVLPHSGQIYRFSQTKAMLTGFELENTYWFNKFKTEIVLEYIYNRQIKEKYPLPFTPPFNAFARLDYFFDDNKLFKNSNIYINGKYFAAQNRIAQNEEITPSSVVFGTGFSSNLNIGKVNPKLTISVQNIFDTRYYSHMSFYRALEIPEQGRNIQIMLSFEF